jgi:transcriptional regulator GlxA family with amidase domain
VAVGFHDQAHLTRHFRRLLGVAPAAYARSAQ